MAGQSDANALLLQVSADVSKLQKQFDKAAGIVDAGSKRMESRARKAGAAIEDSFNSANVGKALDRIFDNSRLKVFDSASARIGITGKALELLGPAGLTAAAGVVAVGAAFAEARGAAKFADDIQDTAARLHTTTDALQEFRYANFQAGGSMEGADQALEAFSANLGKAQEGLKKGQRAFLALGFTKDQIKGFTDADSALKAVTARIAELKSDPQKDALIDQLGLTGMKPLILEGVSAMEDLRRKAHEIGIVMDADLINRGAEANKQFEVLTKVIDVQLKSAFIDLAPVLLDLLKFAADLAKQINAIADTLRSVEHKSNSGLLDAKAKNTAVVERLGIKQLTGERLSPTEQNLLLKSRMALFQIDSEISARSAAPPPSIPHGSRSLIDQGAGRTKAPTDHTADDLARGHEEALKAVAAADAEVRGLTDQITSSIEERLRVERDILKVKEDERNRELDRKVKEGKMTAADAEAVKAAEHEVVLAKENNLAFEAFRKQQDVLDAHQAAMVGFVTDQLNSQSALANTAEERRKLALEVYEAERKQARSVLERDLGRNPDLTPEQKAAELAGFDKSTDLGGRAVQKANQGPVQAYLDSLKDLDTQFQTLAVQGVKDLSDALANTILNAQDFGSALTSIFRQIFAEILSAQIQKSLVGPILGTLGLGHAAGGWISGPGGPTDDRVLTPTSAGEFVVNARDAGRNGDLLEAINSGSDFSSWLSGQSGGAGASGVRVLVGIEPSPLFRTFVRQEATPIAQRYAQASGQAARHTARADAQRSQRQTIR